MGVALSTWKHTAAVGVRTKPNRQKGLTVKKKSPFKKQHTFALSVIITVPPVNSGQTKKEQQPYLTALIEYVLFYIQVFRLTNTLGKARTNAHIKRRKVIFVLYGGATVTY